MMNQIVNDRLARAQSTLAPLAATILATASGFAGAETGEAEKYLQPLAYLAGHCWTATFADGKTTDTHCYEWMHGGRQLRDTHTVRGAAGEYRGETVYLWDAEHARIVYRYVDANGGHSDGHVEAVGDALRFPQDRYVGADGRKIHFVSEWRRTADDRFHMLARQQVGSELREALNLYFTRAAAVSSRVTTEADGTRSIVTEALIDAPIAEVWGAFTTADGWRSWAVPFAAIDWKVGGLIETSYDPAARAGDPNNIHNRILAYLPHRMLAFRAERAPPGFKHVELLPGLHSVVEFEPIDGRRTRVRLIGLGYREGAGYDELLQFFEKGNTWSLQQLAKRFKDGPVDWVAVLEKPAAKGAK
jgi:uncharacterized protein YndB with AHSA1/START domain